MLGIEPNHGVPVNHGFSGAYDYNAPQAPIGELFARFIAGAGENALVMCHPGYSDASLAAKDTLTGGRDGEYELLMSPRWLEMVAAAGFTLAPLRRMPHHVGTSKPDGTPARKRA